jgi:hypothetical protein
MNQERRDKRLAMTIIEPVVMAFFLACLPAEVYTYHSGIQYDFGYIVFNFNVYWGPSFMPYPDSIPGIASMAALVLSVVMLVMAIVLVKNRMDELILRRWAGFNGIMLAISIGIIGMCMLNFGGGFNMFLFTHPDVRVVPVSSLGVLVLSITFLIVNKGLSRQYDLSAEPPLLER